MNDRGFVLLPFLIIIIIVGILLVFFFQSKSPNLTENYRAPIPIAPETTMGTPKPSKTPTTIPTPTPADEVTHLNVSSENQLFEGGWYKWKYQIEILPGWIVQGDSAKEDILISFADNQDYNIKIGQGGTSGFKCVYPGESVRENTNDQEFGEYIQINNFNNLNFRRSLVGTSSLQDNRNSLWFYICEYSDDGKGYYFPTDSFALIMYYTPNPADVNLLSEMDQMLSSIKNISGDNVE